MATSRGRPLGIWEKVTTKVITGPLKLDHGDLYEDLCNFIKLEVQRIVTENAVHPENLCTTGGMNGLKSSDWTAVLSKEIGVPIEVKLINYAHDYSNPGLHQLAFCIEMEDNILKAYNNLYKNRLLELIEELDDDRE